MLSYFFGGGEEEKQDDVSSEELSEINYSDCDECDIMYTSDITDSDKMTALCTAIEGNLRKEYLLTAWKQLENLDEMVYNAEKDDKLEIPEEVYQFINGEQAERARNDINAFNMYIKHIEDFSRDWELYDENDHCKIYNKPNFETDVTSFTFGGDCVVNHSLFRPASMMGEYEKLSDWVPTLSNVDVIHEQSVLKRLIHLKIDLPIPFSNRDLLIEGTGHINEEEKSVWFLMNSFFGDNYFGTPIDDESEGRLRMDLKHGFLYIKHLDDNSCHCKIVINVDMKIGMAQSWVGSMVMNKVVKVWINNIVEQSKNFEGSVYQKKLNKNPLYKFIAKRLGLMHVYEKEVESKK